MHGILFDKDGTLIDFEATWAPILGGLALELADGDEAVAQAMLVAGGLDPEAGTFRAGSVIAAGTAADVARLWFPALDGQALAAMVARIDRTFHEGGARCSVLLPGVPETLAALADDRFVMGVATNDATAAAKAALAALGLDRFLTGVFGYDAVARAKPAPDMVLAFAAHVGLPPGDIIVVGDNVHDLAMARAAGAAAAIGVTSGNSAAAHLAPLADVVLDSICDLPDWLHQNRK